jgi:hypothetical protein
MRWRAAAAEAHPEDDFEDEQLLRLTVLEVLYSERRAEPEGRGIFVLDLEDLTGRPREHLEFTLWFLKKKHLIESGDSSRMNITVEGVEYFEEHYRSGLLRRRLKAADAEDGPETSGEERAGKREPR